MLVLLLPPPSSLLLLPPPPPSSGRLAAGGRELQMADSCPVRDFSTQDGWTGSRSPTAGCKHNDERPVTGEEEEQEASPPADGGFSSSAAGAKNRPMRVSEIPAWVF
ncbi:unnamed protein product [Pleuronectes platessa]|uniref:Uncharacterized protein n=1 Tax=Pleuronectes platessa TaxID=8262 RepID=A0A9N7Y6R4_PLEPL|nr:unnamed protein product [Pleuronectes platessa]